MPQTFTNNAVSTLAAAILVGDTSLTLATGDGARFPALAGGDYFLLTLEAGPLVTDAREIVRVTARAGDVLTVTRAQEGTTAQGWASGTVAELRMTAGTLEALLPVAAGAGGTTLRRAGAWFTFPHDARTNGSPNLNDLYYIPIVLARPAVVDQIAGALFSTGTAGALLRLGVYDSDPTTGLPSTLRFDAGTVDASGAAGSVAIDLVAAGVSLAARTLPVGLVYLAYVMQGATRGLYAANGPLQVPTSAGHANTNITNRFVQGSVSGALPSTAPDLTTSFYGLAAHLISLREAA